MKSTRRELLRSAAALGGGLLFVRLGAACAGPTAESEEVGADESNLVTCSPPVIADNHGHALVVSPADVAAGVAKTYSIQGASSHSHDVTLSAADFATLALGASVIVTSTNEFDHEHDVTVTCATIAPARCSRGATASAISGNHGHALSVPQADVDAGKVKRYSINGTASHAHTVVITPALFTKLKTTGTINVTSSLALAHTHVVTVTCS